MILRTDAQDMHINVSPRTVDHSLETKKSGSSGHMSVVGPASSEQSCFQASCLYQGGGGTVVGAVDSPRHQIPDKDLGYRIMQSRASMFRFSANALGICWPSVVLSGESRRRARIRHPDPVGALLWGIWLPRARRGDAISTILNGVWPRTS